MHLPATLLAKLAADPSTGADWAAVITDLAVQYGVSRDQHAQGDHRCAPGQDPGARFAGAVLRRHVQVRDRCCVMIGCCCPTRHADLDHTVDHSRGGTTTEANSGPLYKHDHLLKHDGGWRLCQPEPGHFIWTSPLGGTYHTRPQPITTDLPDPVPGPDYPDYTPPATGDEGGPILYRAPHPNPSRRPHQPDPDEPPLFWAAAEPTSARARARATAPRAVGADVQTGRKQEGGWTMTAMTEPIGLAEGRPFTVHDLEAMPDDGRRYELIDGMLLVTPAPGWSHQEMAATLYRVLHAACPPELRVLLAPFAVRTSPLNEVQPDVLGARYTDLTEACLPVAPLLAAEVLSRSTQLGDRNTKKAHYERLGVESYWLLDPVQPGGLQAYELDEPAPTCGGGEWRRGLRRLSPVPGTDLPGTATR